MNASQIAVIALVATVLIYAYSKSKKGTKEGLAMVPPANKIPAPLDPRSGLTTSYTRDYPSLSGVDFADIADSVTADRPVKDKVVGELLSVQDMLPDGTLGGIRHTDPGDTRQITVQLRNPYQRESNPWVIAPVIEPVNSVHRMFDVDPAFHTPSTAYDSYDPERYAASLRRT